MPPAAPGRQSIGQFQRLAVRKDWRGRAAAGAHLAPIPSPLTKPGAAGPELRRLIRADPRSRPSPSRRRAPSRVDDARGGRDA